MINLKVKKLSGLNKSKGLIGAEKADAVFFETRFGIHTFGLKFPLDVLILDNKNIVVKLKENLKPNRIFLWNPAWNKCIELTAGEIKKKNIEIGTEINLKSV